MAQFATANKRLQHFGNHGVEFGASDEFHYERMADAFITGPKQHNTLECKRPRENDIIRYNFMSNEFGVLSYDGYIRTYFKPDPLGHHLPRNLDYYLVNSVQI